MLFRVERGNPVIFLEKGRLPVKAVDNIAGEDAERSESYAVMV
jgi:hypothetical protein